MTPRERLEARLQADMRELLMQPAFRRFVMFLYDDPAWCGVPGDVDADDENAAVPMFKLGRRLGRRSIGIQLMAYAQRANPDMAQRVVTEWTNFRREIASIDSETKES